MFLCPVCSHNMPEAPVDYTICEHCGTEFGNDDDGVSHEELRKRWEGQGSPPLIAPRVHHASLTHLVFHCPACKYGHNVLVNAEGTNTAHFWGWNGSLALPTFTPSILVRGNEFGGTSPRCHSFVTDGKIQFLSDCTHDLRGQTVDLPDWDDGTF